LGEHHVETETSASAEGAFGARREAQETRTLEKGAYSVCSILFRCWESKYLKGKNLLLSNLTGLAELRSKTTFLVKDDISPKYGFKDDFNLRC
jgi:hypothetical protein